MILVFLAVAFLQDTDLAPYVSPRGERSFVYRRGETELRMEIAGDATRWARSWSDGRRFVESFDAEAGLLLHALVFGPGDELEYERPVVVLPPRLEPGKLHESQRRFVRRKNGAKADVGAHAFEAEVLGFEEVETPVARFEGCLKLRRIEVRMDFSGSQERWEAIEWYAPGVGLVKSSASRDVEGRIETAELLLLRLSDE